MTDVAVSIQGLVKRYGSVTAVHSVNLEIERGEIFGLLGPNGSGKTSVLECLEGIRRADAGKLRVAGCDPQSNDVRLRRKLGVQLQVSSLPDSLRVDEAIALVCSWKHAVAPKELTEVLGVGEFSKKTYKQLSTGQQRRLHLLLALLNEPEVLILDEPTAGLDVQSRIQLHQQIKSVQARGVTVLLATHDMVEAEQLCHRVAILIRGQVATCGTPHEVMAAGRKDMRVRIRTTHGSLSPTDEISSATFVGQSEGFFEWTCSDVSNAVIELLTKVRMADDFVEDLRVDGPTLEDRFLQYIEGAGVK